MQIIGSLHDSIIEYDYYNNSAITRFSKIGDFSSMPFIEHFENGINDSIWCISNLDNDQTWVVDSTVGLPWSNLSACMKLYSYSPRENQKDGLLTPNISLSPSLVGCKKPPGGGREYKIFPFNLPNVF